MADILKSFEVALGFKIDQESLRKFHDQMQRTRVAITSFAAAAGALALGVEEAIRRTSRSYEDLFYLSQRTGVSAENLKALGFAFTKIGLEARDAGNMMSQIAARFRDDPGIEKHLQNILGSFQGAEGAFEAIQKRIGEINKINDPQERAWKYAALRALVKETLGLEVEQLHQVYLNQEEINRSKARGLALMQKYNLDATKVSENSKNLNNAWRDFWEEMEVIYAKVIDTTLPTIKRLLVDFTNWVGSPENVAKINAWIIRLEQWFKTGDAERDVKAFATELKKAFDDVLLVVNAIIDAAKWLNRNTQFLGTTRGEAARKITGAPPLKEGEKEKPGMERTMGGDIWRAFKGASQIDLIERVWEGGRRLLGGSEEDPNIPADRAGRPHRYAGPPMPTSPFSGNTNAYLEAMWMGFQHWWAGSSAFSPQVVLSDSFYEKLTSTLREVFDLGPGNEGKGGGAAGYGGGGGNERTGGRFGGAGPGRGGGGFGGSAKVPSLAAGNFRNQAIDYFMSQGWTKEQAAGIAANIETESSWRHDAKGDSGAAYGLAQWHPDRQANFQRVFGKPIQQSTREEQLAFINWELHHTEKAAGDRLRRQTTARGSGGVVSQYYERPGDREGNIASRGALAESQLASYKPSGYKPGDEKEVNAGGAGDGRSTFVVHHTGGGGTAEDVMATLNQRGLGVQYIMDREGNITKTGMENTQHIRPNEKMGLSNANTVGMEVIAKNDADITQAQVEAAKKFYAAHPELKQVYGHGEVNPGHKEATEGATITKALREMNRGSTSASAGAGAGGKGIMATAAAITDGIQAVVGDSIAVGIGKATGLPMDAVGGSTPEQIYARVTSHLQDFAGKTVGLAIGSNQRQGGGGAFDPKQQEFVKKTVAALHGVGAKVVMAGIGEGVRDRAKILAGLHESGADAYADDLLPTTEGGRVHPRDYHPAVDQMNKAIANRNTTKSAATKDGAIVNTYNNNAQVHVSVDDSYAGKAIHSHIANNWGDNNKMPRNTGTTRALA